MEGSGIVCTPYKFTILISSPAAESLMSQNSKSDSSTSSKSDVATVKSESTSKSTVQSFKDKMDDLTKILNTTPDLTQIHVSPVK